MSSKIVFRCARCENIHEGLPAIAYDAPSYYYSLSEAERQATAELTDDTCIVGGDHHFVRAVLEIPILGHTEHLEWGVWGSLSKANFDRYNASFYDHDQSTLGPMFSWFASQLTGYPDTRSLRCNLVPRHGGLRPFVDFHPGDEHPLALDKRNGISIERAIEFVVPVLHKH